MGVPATTTHLPHLPVFVLVDIVGLSVKLVCFKLYFTFKTHLSPFEWEMSIVNGKLREKADN